MTCTIDDFAADNLEALLDRILKYPREPAPQGAGGQLLGLEKYRIRLDLTGDQLSALGDALRQLR